MWAWLASTALGAFFKGLFGAVVQAFNDAQVRADEQKLGQATQKAVDQAAALEAYRRMQAAAAEPKGPEATKKALDDGSF